MTSSIDPTTASATQTDGEPATKEPWREAFEQLNGRISKMGQDLGAVREKVKGSAQTEPQTATTPAALTREDVAAARKLERIVAKLSPEVASYFDEREAAGDSFSAMLREAELLQKFGANPAGANQQQSAGRDAPAGPRGYGAMPPQSTGVDLPKSMAELMTLKQKNPAAWERVMDHPSFDPKSLPQF